MAGHSMVQSTIVELTLRETIKNEVGNTIFFYGTAVASTYNSKKGFEAGCLYMRIGTSGGTIYVNTGSATSSSFSAMNSSQTGDFTSSTLLLSTVAVAAAGTGQSTYQALTSHQLNAITGADNTVGVALPAAAVGDIVVIINTDATHTLPVSPVNGGNDAINSLTAGTGVFTMGPAQVAIFVPTSVTQWYVAGQAAVTATAAEINVLHGATAGSAVASHALVADANNYFQFGVRSSANDTSGVTVSAAVDQVFGVFADSGGVALTAGFIRSACSRMFVGTAISGGGDISITGQEGLVKFGASANIGGNVGGVMGHLETTGTLTLTGSLHCIKSAVAAFLDLASGTTIAASTVVSAFGVNAANLGTVMTGRSTIIHVTNPMASTWGSFAEFDSATGCTAAHASAGADGGIDLLVRVNGSAYAIRLMAVGT